MPGTALVRALYASGVVVSDFGRLRSCCDRRATSFAFVSRYGCIRGGLELVREWGPHPSLPCRYAMRCVSITSGPIGDKTSACPSPRGIPRNRIRSQRPKIIDAVPCILHHLAHRRYSTRKRTIGGSAFLRLIAYVLSKRGILDHPRCFITQCLLVYQRLHAIYEQRGIAGFQYEFIGPRLAHLERIDRCGAKHDYRCERFSGIAAAETGWLVRALVLGSPSRRCNPCNVRA
jgi:hypothetical protein